MEKYVKARLKAGDLVRVRSRPEIEATLDSSTELNGCAFMEDMWFYCETTHIVKKRVEKILDERDYLTKECDGIVILEGVVCRGTKDYPDCDRSCFLFWREEWLKRVEQV